MRSHLYDSPFGWEPGQTLLSQALHCDLCWELGLPAGSCTEALMGRFRLEIMKHRGPGYWCLSQNLLCSGGFPSAASGKKTKQNKKPACQHRKRKRCGLDPWVRKIPWRRACNILQYSCLENPHGQRSLAGYSPKGRKEWDTTNVTYLACSIFPDSTYMLIYSICF